MTPASWKYKDKISIQSNGENFQLTNAVASFIKDIK